MHESPVLIFDGVCKLCNGMVTLILKQEKHPLILFTTLQSDQAKKLLANLDYTSEKIKSVVFIEKGNIYFKSEAVFKIAAYLKSPYSNISKFSILPRFITDFVYNIIAGIRYHTFGKRTVCMVPDESVRNRFL